MFRLAFVMALGLAAAGCSAPNNAPTAYPVGGKVLLPSGEPARGAEVTFIPKTKGEKTTGAYGSAILTADGAFALKSMGDADGVPPGYYAVVISPKKLPAANPDRAFGEKNIPRKYWSEETTNLTAEIDGTKPDLEFRLVK